MRACVSRTWMSRHCRIEMENVAVLPVPDWALDIHNGMFSTKFVESVHRSADFKSDNDNVKPCTIQLQYIKFCTVIFFLILHNDQRNKVPQSPSQNILHPTGKIILDKKIKKRVTS